MTYKSNLLLFFFFSISLVSFAQSGHITGIVLDSETKQPMLGAVVQIEGTDLVSTTDWNGEFKIHKIPEGVYAIKYTYLSYKPFIQKELKITPNKPHHFQIELEAKPNILDAVIIVSNGSNESESALLNQQQKAVNAIQSIGAQELSRKGVGNAEMAITKVSGISKQEGVKNVFIRGLGDRYNATLFNGMPIPSDDPEYKNIGLDVFSSDIIQSVGVNKVFTGSKGGDVAGAIIDIRSKELYGNEALEFESSIGINTEANKADFLQLDGSNYFGFSTSKKGNSPEFNFKNSLDPSTNNMPLNHSYKLAGGKRYYLNDQPLSFFLVAKHATSYSSTEEKVRNINTAGTLYQDQTGNKHSISNNQLLLANLNYEHKDSYSLAYNFMMNHGSHQYVGEYSGKHSERHQDGVDDMGYLRRQQLNDNLLLTHQLLTNWKLHSQWQLYANFSYNNLKAKEPDRRENYLSLKPDGTYGLTGSNRQKRFFSDLNSEELYTNLYLAYKFGERFGTESSLNFGYQATLSDNDFESTEFNFSPIQGSFDKEHSKLDALYNKNNFDQGLFSMQLGNPNTYSVNKTIHSVYVDADYPIAKNLIGNIGFRTDQVDMKIAYDVSGKVDDKNKIKKTYFLPSLNLKYDLNANNSLRLGMSKSYTLPQSKEISPYQYVNIGFASEGNPNLKPSENYNIDLKWDNYLSPTELLSVTAFYKHILDPIGRVDQGNSAGLLTYDNIADNAKVMGVELEFRKNLIATFNETTLKENKLSFGLNTSWLYTHLTLDLLNTPSRKSELEGASPFIINTDLSYELRNEKNKSFITSLVFNYFSDRIYTNGTLGFQDIVEEGIGRLDFVNSFAINQKMTVKLKATNLLNPTYKLTRENNVTNTKTSLNEFKKGINIELGISLNI